MIVYQSKSEACVKLLNEVGIGDFGYKSACALELGDVLVGGLLTIMVILVLYFPISSFFSSKE